MRLLKIQRTTSTMKEAADYLGISYWLINQSAKRKQIPCSKVGGKYLFRVKVLDEYLTQKEEVLGVTRFDDYTVEDFGEVKYKYQNKYYKVIIWTRHNLVFGELY